MIKIGIIREGKVPADSRVAMSPAQCKVFMDKHKDISFVIQPSPDRCFTDEEYASEKLKLSDDLSQCEILLGIKEVQVEQLIANKTYLFFSHTIKAQLYNRHLLQTILEKKIRLIDYECLVNEKGERIIAFGRFAGIVGAHNGLMAFGRKQKSFDLPAVHSKKNLETLFQLYEQVDIPPMKIALTGSGRVAKGCVEVFEHLNIQSVTPEDFLQKSFDKPVYTMLEVNDLYAHKEKAEWEVEEFYNEPENFDSVFMPYTKVADLMVNAIYWDPKAPVFFTTDDMRRKDFSIKVVADITCDIGGSVPATIRPSTIQQPVYGFDPRNGSETAPYLDDTIDIMAIDNLPNELPRDASAAFGEVLSDKVLPYLLSGENNQMIEKATIARDGKLTSPYMYLEDFVNTVI